MRVLGINQRCYGKIDGNRAEMRHLAALPRCTAVCAISNLGYEHGPGAGDDTAGPLLF
jgi:hypothetical protein